MTTRATAPSISETAVRQLSEQSNDPQWFADRRLEAYRAYQSLSMPDPLDEEWRRTDISGLDLAAVLDATGSASTRRGIHGADLPLAANRIEGLPAGVFFGTFDEAREHDALLQRVLGTLVKEDECKLSALQASLAQQGTLVYVPRGVEVEVPLSLVHSSEGMAVFPHLVIYAEPGSGVTVFQDNVSADTSEQLLASGAVEIFAMQDARVHYVDLQRWGSNAYNFSTVRVNLDRGAQFSGALIGIGGRVSRTKLEVDLAGEGASAQLLGLSFGSDHQHFDYTTLQNHIAPHTSSDLAFKAALTDSASEVWYGTVRIQPGASQSEASQTSRNLLLSDHAKAAPIPVLEIEAHDILRCSHGATAGPLDEEQRFYLESRGIPPAETEQLLVEAFFRELIDRLPNEQLRESVAEQIMARLEASR
jgi:Fe-S cluster assembly protein SufD